MNEERQDAKATAGGRAVTNNVEGPQETLETNQAAESSTVELAELATQLTSARAEAAEYLNQWQRAVADLSNARKRMLREQAEFNATATARVLEKLLPVVDDVDRALEALPPEQAGGDWVSGFRLIQRKLQGVLESEGVSVIATDGQCFDPLLHYAVTHEQHEGFAEGQIIGEVARGYKLGDRVLRPSMVRVASGIA